MWVTSCQLGEIACGAMLLVCIWLNCPRIAWDLLLVMDFQWGLPPYLWALSLEMLLINFLDYQVSMTCINSILEVSHFNQPYTIISLCCDFIIDLWVDPLLWVPTLRLRTCKHLCFTWKTIMNAHMHLHTFIVFTRANAFNVVDLNEMYEWLNLPCFINLGS